MHTFLFQDSNREQRRTNLEDERRAREHIKCVSPLRQMYVIEETTRKRRLCAKMLELSRDRKNRARIIKNLIQVCFLNALNRESHNSARSTSWQPQPNCSLERLQTRSWARSILLPSTCRLRQHIHSPPALSLHQVLSKLSFSFRLALLL